MSSERYSTHSQDRYGTMASQGGTSALMPFPPQQNAPRASSVTHAPMQHQYRSQPTALQRDPVVMSSSYFSPQPQFTHQPHPPLSPYPPAMAPPLRQPMNFMHQSPMSPHPGMAPNHRFGQAPYFNNSSPSPMGMPPPPPASPVAFSYRSDGFMNQQANFSNQPPPFLNRPLNQPTNFVTQPLSPNPLPGRPQWQNGPPSPYGMTPLSISIPNAPPSNAIYTPVPSPYNMWGSKSLNFPQSGYFGNNAQ